MCDCEMKEKSSPGKGRRWRAINAGEEPFSGTSNSYQGHESQGDEKKWWDAIEHPERYIKGEK